MPISIGERKVMAHLDSGNSATAFALPAALAMDLPQKNKPRAAGQANTMSKSFKLQRVTLDASIRMGSAIFTDPQVTFPSPGPMPNIGSKALIDYELTIDQRNQRVRLTGRKQ